MDTIEEHRPPVWSARAGFRRLVWTGAALGVAVLATGLVWIVAPALGPYTERTVALQTLLPPAASGPVVPAVVQTAIGAAATAIALLVLFGRMRAGAVFAAVGLVCGSAVALGLVGFNGIVLAGYLLAMTAPIAIVAAAIVFALRRPRAGGLALLGAAALLAVAIFGPAPVGGFYARAFVGLAERGLVMVSAVMCLLFAGVWLLCAVLVLAPDAGALGRFARRRRIPITILAACCAVPYVIARASWLTPWPLFGGEAIAEGGAAVQVTGLMLAGAVLVGGVLTLGLILPWGSTFPRWVPRVGGSPVPTALAVVPASIVAVLFTAGGVESVVVAMAQGASPVDLLVALVLPFWLWGPLLALATWGYGLQRASVSEAHAGRDDAEELSRPDR